MAFTYLCGFGILPTLEQGVKFSHEELLSPSKIVTRGNPQGKIWVLHCCCDILDNSFFIYADRQHLI